MYFTEAIILKKSDSGEADRIFTCYTKEFGKIKVLAKGARKAAGKLKYHLEPLTHSEISFVFGKNFSAEGPLRRSARLVSESEREGEASGSAFGRKILTGARSLNVFSSIKSDLNKLNYAFYFTGLLDDLAAGEEKDGKIWEHLAFSLEFLEQTEAPDEIFSEKFVSKLLYHFGYLPNSGNYKDYREDLNKYLCRDLGRKYDFSVLKESEM